MVNFFENIRLDQNSVVRFHNLVPGHRMPFVKFCGFCVLRWLSPADRKRYAVQGPETVGTHLMFALADSIFVHTMIKPVCLCRVNRGRDWPASALFGRGRAVSNSRRGRMGQMIQAHVSDRWVLVRHI